MKSLIKTIAVSALLASFAAPTFAAVQHDVVAAAGTNSNINVEISGDTVTLTGYVDDAYSRQRAAQVAKSEGYTVRNYLILNN